MTDAAVAVPPPLLVTDRCDRCGARAAHRVQLHAGDLQFCSHHYKQHGAALAKQVKVPSSM